MQVLRCLMRHIESGVQEGRTKFQSAKRVFLQIAAFYAKVIIPTISEINSCERLLRLLDDNAKLRAIPNKRRLRGESQGFRKWKRHCSRHLHCGHVLKTSLRTLRSAFFISLRRLSVQQL